MSFFKSAGRLLGKVISPIAKVASFVPGPVGVLGRVASAVSKIGSIAVAAQGIRSTLSSASNVAQIAAGGPMSKISMLPALRMLPGVGTVAAGAGGALVRGGRAAGAMVGRMARNPNVQKWTRRGAQAAGYIVTAGLIYDQAGNIVGRAQSRRMNPLNHRALRRAISRVKGAKKICKTVEKLTGGSRRRSPPARKC